jgi:tetratricopeptide (TPR) repeat protein
MAGVISISKAPACPESFNMTNLLSQVYNCPYLNTATLAKALNSDAARGAGEAELALAILQTMAFVGQPVEVSTLIHCPLVAKFDAYKFDELSEFMERLCGLGLVALMKRYPDNLVDEASVEPETGNRYGLHRALLHEIRDRYTVPLSDARTYTSFNIPLFAAQPIDDSEPSDETYDQLEGLIKGLIGAPWHEIKRHEYVYGMRLRAAAASMRSYYTASALLMHEPAAAPSEVPSTRLTDHARLVEQLIKAFELNSKERFKEYPAADAPRCVFPDDLVWMHDQRGVTLLAQGDLYEARYSFSQARHINAQFIERSANNSNSFEGVSGQNWRRIILNEIHVDIERGKISDAEDKIRSFEQSIEDLCLSVNWRSNQSIFEDEPSSNSTAIDEILARYAAELNDNQRQVDAVFPAEAVLGVALALHYKGWCAFLSGKIKTAESIVDRAVMMLCNLGEQRAFANSLRLLASIQRAMANVEGARKSIRLCLAAADAGRQMDISHHAWIARCELDLEGETERGDVEILKQLNASLRYATLTDMFRVKMEARMVLAKMRMSGGDYDGALEHASDALALAMRFGFVLRKVTLRIMIGEILVQRGDPYSGRSMLDQAMQEADSIGYQRAVEKVHQVQLKHFG